MTGIDKLLIRGIRSFSPYEENVIEFYSPLTIIVGQNGTGKTTIIECLKYATCGDLPPNSKGGAFVHDPNLSRETEVKGQIKLKFRNIHNQTMVCTRSLQSIQKKMKIEQKTLESLLSSIDPLTGEQISLSSRSSELDIQVPNNLGVSRAILENVIFCHQEDSFWPLSEPSILKKKFDDIFASTLYTKSLDTIRSLRKEMASDMKIEDERLLHHGERVSQLQTLEEQFLSSQARVDETESLILYLESKEIPVLREEKQRIQEEFEKNRRLNDLIYKKEQEIDLLRQQSLSITSSPSTIILHERDLCSLEQELHRHEEENSTKIDKLNELEDDLRCGEKRLTELDTFLQESRLPFLKNEFERKKVLEMECREYLFNNNVRREDKSLKDLMDERINNLKEEKEKLNNNLKEEIANDSKKRLLKVEGDLRQNSLISQKKHFIEKIIEKKERFNTIESCIADNENSENDENDEKILEQKVKIDNIKTEISHLLPNGHETLQGAEKRLSELNELEDRIEKYNNSFLQYEIKEEDLKNQMNQLLKKSFPLKIEPILKKLKISSPSLNGDDDDISLKISSLEGKLMLLREEKRMEENSSQECLDRLRKTLERISTTQKHIEKEIFKQEDILSTNRRSIKRCLEGLGITNIKENEPEISLKVNLKGLEDQLEREGNNNVDDDHHHLSHGNKSCPLCLRTFPPEKSMSWEEMQEILLKRGGTPMLRENIKCLQLQLPKALECSRIMNSTIPSLIDERDNTSGSSSSDYKKKIIELEEAEYSFQKVKEETSLLLDEQFPIIFSFIKEVKEVIACIKDHVLPVKSFSSSEEEEFLALQHCIDVTSPLQKSLHREEEIWYDINCTLSKRSLQRERLQEWRSEREGISLTIRDLQGELSLIENAINDGDNFEIIPFQESREPQIRESLLLLAETELSLEGVRQKWRIIEGISITMEDITSMEKENSIKKEEISFLRKKNLNIKGDLDHLRKEGNTLLVERRNLEDNIRFLKLKDEISLALHYLLEMEKPSLKSLKNLEDEKEKKEEELLSSLSKKSGLQGEQKQLLDKILEIKKLMQPLKMARKDWKEAMVSLHCIKAAMHDLELYGKALDMAILRFHGERMAEINRIIREIWQDTYQGADIDSIEIRTEKEISSPSPSIKNTSPTTTDFMGPRSYAYRVVMVKGGVELDMRGRSSAGQRVLASLIIRLALAETFGQQCSILALDEPTTNLDRENIESLAASLYRIIKGREKTQFQLIIITHDEEFVDLLGRHECASWYWRVGRDDRQYSRIERQSFTNDS